MEWTLALIKPDAVRAGKAQVIVCECILPIADFSHAKALSCRKSNCASSKRGSLFMRSKGSWYAAKEHACSPIRHSLLLLEQLTRARAEEFYGEHKGKAFFAGLVDFMTSGPIEALMMFKGDAIKGWRALMGPTNSARARAEAPQRCTDCFCGCKHDLAAVIQRLTSFPWHCMQSEGDIRHRWYAKRVPWQRFPWRCTP